MKDKKEAWAKLSNAAKVWIISPSTQASQALANAAEEWALAKGYLQPSSSGSSNQIDKVVPFGRSKGVLLIDAETKDLEWVAERLRESIDDPEKRSVEGLQ